MHESYLHIPAENDADLSTCVEVQGHVLVDVAGSVGYSSFVPVDNLNESPFINASIMR